MLGCTALLLLASLPGAEASSKTTILPSGDCEFNAGDCDGGSCYVNAGYCAGNCYINTGTCEEGGSCTVNAGSCSLQEALLSGIRFTTSSSDLEASPIIIGIPADCTVNLGTCANGQCFVNSGYCAGSCYINLSYCSGDCTINAGPCYSSGSCYVNLGTCRSVDLLGLLTASQGARQIDGPELPDIYTPGGHGGDCKINAGDCNGGSCYFNAGSCAGSCTWNVGTCEEGGSCYVNAGSCSLQESLLGAVQASSSSGLKIPPIVVVSLPSGDCEINTGDCDGGSCYLNAGYCAGSCTWNVGTCEEGASCYVNVGSCRTQMELLALVGTTQTSAPALGIDLL